MSISTYRSLLIMFYGDGEVPASVNPKENKEKPTAAAAEVAIASRPYILSGNHVKRETKG